MAAYKNSTEVMKKVSMLADAVTSWTMTYATVSSMLNRDYRKATYSGLFAVGYALRALEKFDDMLVEV